MTKKERVLRRKRAEETTRMYKWEDRTLKAKQLPYTLTCERTMADLNHFAALVWEKHGRKGWKMPVMTAWNGIYWKQYDKEYRGWSYQLGRIIKLAKRHRNRMVVLHELTHALGFGNHGRGFARKYGELLIEYAGLDPAWLELSMGMYGVKLESLVY